MVRCTVPAFPMHRGSSLSLEQGSQSCEPGSLYISCSMPEGHSGQTVGIAWGRRLQFSLDGLAGGNFFFMGTRFKLGGENSFQIHRSSLCTLKAMPLDVNKRTVALVCIEVLFEELKSSGPSSCSRVKWLNSLSLKQYPSRWMTGRCPIECEQRCSCNHTSCNKVPALLSIHSSNHVLG